VSIDDAFAVRVECYPGDAGEETPQRFYVGARSVAISEIVDRWLAPDYRYFKVRGADGHTYLLRHDVTAAHWALTQFRRSDQPA
jgi:hypothetical protein